MPRRRLAGPVRVHDVLDPVTRPVRVAGAADSRRRGILEPGECAVDDVAVLLFEGKGFLAGSVERGPVHPSARGIDLVGVILGVDEDELGRDTIAQRQIMHAVEGLDPAIPEQHRLAVRPPCTDACPEVVALFVHHQEPLRLVLDLLLLGILGDEVAVADERGPVVGEVFLPWLGEPFLDELPQRVEVADALRRLGFEP